jgi:hypothetical protein
VRSYFSPRKFAISDCRYTGGCVGFSDANVEHSDAEFVGSRVASADALALKRFGVLAGTCGYDLCCAVLCCASENLREIKNAPKGVSCEFLQLLLCRKPNPKRSSAQRFAI